MKSIPSIPNIPGGPDLPSSKKKQKQNDSGFAKLNLSYAVFNAIKKKGFKSPTPIQRKVIPQILQKQSIVAMSRTGSGKTAGFLIPIIEMLKEHSDVVGCRCVIISPTRELAMQTANSLKQFCVFTNLRVGELIGGITLEEQFQVLAQNPDILVVTPGRLIHLITETEYKLSRVEIIVYDEADRLFEMGFAQQLKEINSHTPKSKQSLLFSATMPPQLAEFSLGGISTYKFIQLDKETQLSEKLKLFFFIPKSEEKLSFLIYLLKTLIPSEESTIIFVSTKYHVQYISTLLSDFKMDNVGIYGDLDPMARKIAFAKFRRGDVKTMVVTDLAARGLDIPAVGHVIHYDFPPSPKLFVHRTGRTARQEQKGTAYCVLTMDELSYLVDIGIHIGRKIVNTLTEIAHEPTLNSKDDLFENTEYASYGIVPSNILGDYHEAIKEFHIRNPELDQLLKTVKNGFQKYKKNRTSASQFASKKAKELEDIQFHLLFQTHVNSVADEATETVYTKLAKYRPKSNIFQIKFNKEKTSLQNVGDNVNQNDDHKNIDSKNEEIQDDIQHSNEGIIDEEKVVSSIFAKKRRAPLQGFQIQNPIHTKKIKRSQVRGFNDNPNYISQGPTQDLELQKKLWGNEKPITMNDLIMNMANEKTADDLLKATHEMRWDKKKKNYVQKKIDSFGKVIEEKPQDQKIINGPANKRKPKELYKKWTKNTHLRIQSAGEIEDKDLIQSSRNIKDLNNIRKSNPKIFKAKYNLGLEKVKKKSKQKLMEKVRKNKFARAHSNKSKKPQKEITKHSKKFKQIRKHK